jgi:hypothetical protein
MCEHVFWEGWYLLTGNMNGALHLRKVLRMGDKLMFKVTREYGTGRLEDVPLLNLEEIIGKVTGLEQDDLVWSLENMARHDKGDIGHRAWLGRKVNQIKESLK